MRKELVERLDVNKTIQWFRQYQGWDQQTVQEQVLTPLDDRSLMSTPADQDSIMCYQLPGSITKDGKPINGGVDINQSDQIFRKQVVSTFGRVSGRRVGLARMTPNRSKI
jgi:hypothetical protein